MIYINNLLKLPFNEAFFALVNFVQSFPFIKLPLIDLYLYKLKILNADLKAPSNVDSIV